MKRSWLFVWLLFLFACATNTPATNEAVDEKTAVSAATNEVVVEETAVSPTTLPTQQPTMPPATAQSQTATPSPQATEPPTSTPEPIIWHPLATMRVPRSEMPVVALNGRLYVPGGFGNGFNQADGRRFEAYEIASDTWVSLAEIPFSVNHHGFAAWDGMIYLFPDQKQPVLQYDPAQDQWQERSPMPENRWAGTAVALNNHIYYIGGAGGTTALLRYDPDSDSWTSLAELSQPREHTQAVVLNNEIYAVGGRWNTGLNQVEIYNPESNTWRRGPAMNQRRSGFGAAVWDGKIIVAGGELLSPLAILDTVEQLDPTTNRWTLLDIPLPMPLHGFPMAVENGSLYLIGGSGLAGDVSNRGNLYRLNGEAVEQAEE